MRLNCLTFFKEMLPELKKSYGAIKKVSSGIFKLVWWAVWWRDVDSIQLKWCSSGDRDAAPLPHLHLPVQHLLGGRHHIWRYLVQPLLRLINLRSVEFTWFARSDVKQLRLEKLVFNSFSCSFVFTNSATITVRKKAFIRIWDTSASYTNETIHFTPVTFLLYKFLQHSDGEFTRKNIFLVPGFEPTTF